MKYYSQSGQDRFLNERFFKNQPRGSFVDIGAHDGLSGSNTMFFEALGWGGICFEPIPDVFRQLQLNRKCLLQQVAISDKIGISYFKRIKGHSEMLSGLIDEYSPEHLSRINREFAEHVQEEEVIQVETSTFDKEVKFNHIDILSIDVEGAESTIIKSINFNAYDISFMVVEFNDGHDGSLQDYIISKGYEAITRLGVDLIFKKL